MLTDHTDAVYSVAWGGLDGKTVRPFILISEYRLVRRLSERMAKFERCSFIYRCIAQADS